MSYSNTMNFTGHHVNRLPAYTTTTTTTTSYGPGPSGYCNGSSAYNPANMNSGINLSSKAQILMGFMQMMGQLIGGPFGEVMSSLGIGPQGQGQCQNQMNPLQNPGFGQSRGCGNGGQNMEQQWNEFNQMRQMMHQNRAARPRRGGMQMAADAAKMADFKTQSANAPQAPKGQASEMQAGQTMKAPNGSLVTRHKDGRITIKSLDPTNGQLRNYDISNDGMMRIDGGKPMKLDNTGQMVKLPNGDVVVRGTNPQAPKGQQLSRVAVADSVDQVKCEPKGATNVYKTADMEHTHRGFIPTMANVNINTASYNGFNGSYQMMNANATFLYGTPYEYSHIVREIQQQGVR
ncbi:MAG: hypothetical protein KC800_18375 [Candidatus Eremiobacteraeota bacterium]|nr:hypothetical protein [Candidatus Eremiobacteraeota bacterium]